MGHENRFPPFPFFFLLHRPARRRWCSFPSTLYSGIVCERESARGGGRTEEKRFIYHQVFLSSSPPLCLHCARVKKERTNEEKREKVVSVFFLSLAFVFASSPVLLLLCRIMDASRKRSALLHLFVLSFLLPSSAREWERTILLLLLLLLPINDI